MLITPTLLRAAWPVTRFPQAPAADIVQHGDAYQLYAEVPGCKPEALKIELFDGDADGPDSRPPVLSISGQRDEHVPEDAVLLRSERRHTASFRRAFSLPASVDLDRVTATLQQGLLRVRLPLKAQHEPEQPRQRRVHVSKL